MEATVRYEFAYATKNKIRFDAVDPQKCVGANAVYLNRNLFNGVIPKVVTATYKTSNS